MKRYCTFLSILLLCLAACQTKTVPATRTIDGMTLTLPEGWKQQYADNPKTNQGINSLESNYQKSDANNTANLWIDRFDVAHLEKEDPDFTTQQCLILHLAYPLEGFEKEYPHSQETQFNIGGKTGYRLTYDDLKNPEHPMKGEMIAVKSGQKIIVLQYNDFSDHYDKAKADWEALKASIKIAN
jgi:hypothetical protein